ncbi:hypothetical protein LTR84_005849 [Exophiala bonariae]|uniref:FAD/NAD(P)-binding domain-containing protein n=1 Tax=Exophiala bonariae TaxID=1690606 RepID=A0AAV9N617_9EURO|nr:hypothetical protein LTR84_005849 [Exophiala bonariae]
MESRHQQPTVAVIGLGGQGLATLKNLLEEGFRATAFERRDYVGGIWHHSGENQLSALQSTFVNVSRERACFTDFPFPHGTGSYPNSHEVDQYLNDYCSHFALHPHMRLATDVKSIQRDDGNNKWCLRISTRGQLDETLEFDKLVLATGPHVIPKQPELPGRSQFSGNVLHSIAYKDPGSFRNKRVMVVGMSNSAADTATSLVGIAAHILLSHRRGSVVVPRYLKDGTSLDHNLTYRQFQIKDTLDTVAPSLAIKFLDAITTRISRQNFGELDPAWNLHPPPSLLHQVPTVSDTLIPALRNRSIISTKAPSRVTGPKTILLEDGTTVEVDAIIYCTGYEVDYSILGPYDPTIIHTEGLKCHDKATPRLYQNIFSLVYPESLAFVGIAITLSPAFLLSDLTSMAVAQLWSTKPGSPVLPPQTTMDSWYADHLEWARSIRLLSEHAKFAPMSVKNGPWFRWVQDVAGAEVERNLNYASLQAWKFWWNDRKLCALLTDGIWSPHMYRLFDGDRRQKWTQARATIERVNSDVQERLRARRLPQ